jgi:hypothetical protein
MDLQALIEQITELVVARLSTAGVAASASAGGPPFVVVMGDGERGGEQLSTVLRAVSRLGGRATVVPSALWPRVRLEASIDPAVAVVDAPPAWSGLIAEARAVIVPNLSLNEVAGLGLLIGLTPATAALMAALVEGRPTLAASDDAALVVAQAARVPRAVVEGAAAYLARLAAMGVRLVESPRLGDEIVLVSAPSPAAPSARAGRNVLTADDVERMMRGGARVIEVAAGTIVTALAHEVARAGGAEIVVR